MFKRERLIDFREYTCEIRNTIKEGRGAPFCRSTRLARKMSNFGKTNAWGLLVSGEGLICVLVFLLD
jgi:hypothetical protein